MASILGHFELDFSKPYRQMYLFAPDSCFFFFSGQKLPTAARLAQLDKRRSAEREAAGSSPGRTNTQGL